MTPRIKKKDESRRGAAETDGRTDTYVQETSREADTWLQIKCCQKLEGRRERERHNSVWPKVCGQHCQHDFGGG